MKHFSKTSHRIWHEPKKIIKHLQKHKVPEWHLILGLFLFYVIVVALQLIGPDASEILSSTLFWIEFGLFFVAFIGVFYLETYLLHLASTYFCKAKSSYRHTRIATAVTHLPLVVWVVVVWVVAFLPGWIGFVLLLAWTIYIAIVIFGILAAGLKLHSAWQAFGMVLIVKGLLLAVVTTVFYLLNKEWVDLRIEDALNYEEIPPAELEYIPEGWENYEMK